MSARLRAAAALLAAGATLLAAGPASAAVETTVPATTGDRAFPTSAGGWAGTVSEGGAGCVVLFSPCASAAWDAAGAGGASDGSLRVSHDGHLNPFASVTGTWTSPAFTAPAAVDEGTVSLKVHPVVASFVATAGSTADLDIDMVSTTPAQTIALAHDVSLADEGAWMVRSAAIPAGQIVAGRSYRLRATVTFATGVLSGPAASIRFDDVSLTMRDLLPPSGLSASASAAVPITVSGSADPHDLPTSVTVAYGTAPGSLTQTAGPATVTGAGAQPYSVPLTGLTPGATYHYRVTAANADGATATSEATFSVPMPPSNDPPAVEGSPRERERVAVFDLDAGETAVVRVREPDGDVLSFFDAGGDGREALTLPDADGGYVVTVDRTGDGGTTTSLPVTIILDRVGPALTDADVAVSPAAANVRERVVTVDLPGDVVQAHAQVLDGTGDPVGSAVDVSSGQAGVLLGAADGAYAVRVTVRDAADNATAVVRGSLVLDSTAPALTDADVAVSPATANVRERVVTVELPGDVVQARAQVVDAQGDPVGGDVDVSSGSVPMQLGATDGLYRVAVTVADAVGNERTASSGALELDRDAPAAAFGIDVASASSHARERRVRFSAPSDAVAAWLLVLDSDGAQVGSSVEATSGEADITLPAMPGTYAIRVLLRDAAGNESAADSAPFVLSEAPREPNPEPASGGAATAQPTQDPRAGSGGGAQPGGSALDPGGFAAVLQACYGKPLALTSVALSGRRVVLRGISQFPAGTAIRLLDARGRSAGSAVGRPDGRFEATLPAPGARTHERRAARYQAVVGSQRSDRLGLAQDNALDRVAVAGRTVRLTGRLAPRLRRGRVRWEISGGRGAGACGARAPKLQMMGRPRVNRRTGAYTVAAILPAGAGALVVRTRVNGASSGYSAYVVG